ncbi:WYL domain-containing protein [Sporosarcina sp. ACRSL]|uniref:WYL domain-containing protein n=1 Tax=Sporosarcina sp. ACRSL TaxID=2918215 RepID=UPI001EF747A1|nr:WYL domain-containing protein [Sporosarcina sp. ACRSL]
MKQQTNVKKRQEILRSFFVYDGVHDLNEVMEMLGVSESTYYKTVKEMTDLLYLDEMSKIGRQSNKEALQNRIKYDPYHNMQNFLGRLYQTDKIEETAMIRYALILKLLDHYGELSTTELLAKLGTHFLEESDLDHTASLDKRALKRYVDVLVADGLIVKSSRKGESFYRVQTLFDHFWEDELIDLHAFITFCTYAEIPAAPGFLLLDKLKEHMLKRAFIPQEKLEHTIYQYPYCGRVLDEYMCYELLPILEEGRSVKMRYSPVSEQRKQVVQKSRRSKELIEIIPLKIVFDYHFARWYVLGSPVQSVPGEELQRYRVDYISHISKGAAVDPDLLAQLREQCASELENSWCVNYVSEVTKVKVLFQVDKVETHGNFIKKKVQEQGQWGQITEEHEDGSFVWEIDVRGTAEIIPWLRSFGRGATVLEPVEMRNQMIADLREVLAQYEACE